tara:strand:+ start:373 stop:1170 length:798 start_codon:yes stop_codon:yes gene_type:complete
VTYLDKILEGHREMSKADSRDLDKLFEKANALEPGRGFCDALNRRTSNEVSIIAEIKRKSPSKGNLNVLLDPKSLALEYVSGGASAISVLTDSIHFGGSSEDLEIVSESTKIPILRKDFTVDQRDICDAKIMGADAVLLIVSALEKAELKRFIELSVLLGIDALVEVHDEDELECALKAGAYLIGVNQRDLRTFQVDTGRAVRLASEFPSDVTAVAESGITKREEAQSLMYAGYAALLVGEFLVTSSNKSENLRSLAFPEENMLS